MTGRELVVLGTASQAPTRYRNHNGYLLRFDGQGVLFDPGEGTQRQMLLARVSSSMIDRICITHFHGDHCLGLPGVLGRLALDRVARPVDLYYPGPGQEYLDRLCQASVAEVRPALRLHPVWGDGPVAEGDGDPGPAGGLRVVAGLLDHPTPTVGWRLEEPDRLHLLRPRLDELGVRGPDVGLLLAQGSVRVGSRTVGLDEVSEARRGQKVAFIMDTRWCDAAVELAAGVDLLVCESTFLETEAGLADAYGHLTAAGAARLAAAAGARHLVLTHYSQRHPDEDDFLAEARAVFPSCRAARDLDVIPVPPRAAA